MNSINEAKAFSVRMKNIIRKKFLDEHRDEYTLHCAESRACGYEVVSWQEYLGERDLKAEFSEFYSSMSDQELLDY